MTDTETTTTTIATHQTGTRRALGTDWPVETVVQRVQLPHDSRPRWVVLTGLCDGVADTSGRYTTRHEALAAAGLEAAD